MQQFRNRSLILASLLTIPACSSIQSAERSGQFTRTISCTVEATSRVSSATGTFYIAKPESDLSHDRDLAQIENFLLTEGLTKAPEEKAETLVVVEFAAKNPVTGIAIGNLLPFTHTLSIKGRRRDSTIWELKISGTSEFETIENILPQLLSAGKGYLGKTTPPISVNVLAKPAQK